MSNKDDILVEVKNVSKKFSRSLKRSLWYGLIDMGNAFTGSGNHRNVLREGEFWAVKDMNFSLRRGECIGLIGRNGAGKSTFLKMLNGLIRPDEGSITMRGKIGALIELGAGFNPLLTGRENVYINGQLLGFTKKEINKKFEAILDFAEIGEFIDSPVQNYSSGMKVRLGFAIAAQMEPDVLLIDEVLAVGDIGFVLKCFNKMDELRAKTAMIFVSHAMPQVSRMCTDICLLNNGKSIYQSQDVPAGIMKYYELFKNEIGNFEGSDKVEIKNITLSSREIKSRPDEIFTVRYGHELVVDIHLFCRQAIYKPDLYLIFYDKEQRNFAEVSNFYDHVDLSEVHGNITFRVEIPKIQFALGNYSITIGLAEIEKGVRKIIFRYQSAIYFNVDGKQHGWAPIQLDPKWEAVTNHTIMS